VKRRYTFYRTGDGMYLAHSASPPLRMSGNKVIRTPASRSRLLPLALAFLTGILIILAALGAVVTRRNPGIWRR